MWCINISHMRANKDNKTHSTQWYHKSYTMLLEMQCTTRQWITCIHSYFAHSNTGCPKMNGSHLVVVYSSSAFRIVVGSRSDVASFCWSTKHKRISYLQFVHVRELFDLFVDEFVAKQSHNATPCGHHPTSTRYHVQRETTLGHSKWYAKYVYDHR